MRSNHRVKTPRKTSKRDIWTRWISERVSGNTEKQGPPNPLSLFAAGREFSPSLKLPIFTALCSDTSYNLFQEVSGIALGRQAHGLSNEGQGRRRIQGPQLHATFTIGGDG